MKKQPYLFLLPAMLILAVFSALPVIYALALSVTHLTTSGEMKLIGLRNFRFALVDPLFWRSLKTTLIYMAGSSGLGLAAALGLALLLSRRWPGIGAFRALLFLPAILSDAVVGMLFQWVYADDGMLNRALALVGLGPIPWITSTTYALPSIVLMGAWVGAAYNTPILLNGLLTIPPSLHEAAQLDGAGRFDRLIHVTLPMLRPFLAYVLIMSVIGSFQVFGRIFVLTGGGPVDATLVSVQYIYRAAFTYNQLGYASALSVLLFAFLGMLAWVQWRAWTQSGALA